MKPQLFILGRGRSGSTMLVEMLNMHPEVFVAPEGVFIRNLYQKYHGRKRWKDGHLKAFSADVFTENRMKKLWAIDENVLAKGLVHSGPYNNYGDVCQQVYQLEAEKNGKENVHWLGDKNPHYSLFSHELEVLFPEAKFIHLVRDFKANSASYQKVQFDAQDPIALAYRWKIFNEQIYCHLHGSRNYLQVRYEELASNSSDTLKQICGFLGIPYHPGMLEFFKHSKASRSWHAKLNEPATLDHTHTYFPESTSMQLDAICGPTAVKFGYDVKVHNRVNKDLSFYQGLGKGKLITWLEMAIYSLPLSIRNAIVNIYRKTVGSR